MFVCARTWRKHCDFVEWGVWSVAMYPTAVPNSSQVFELFEHRAKALALPLPMPMPLRCPRKCCQLYARVPAAGLRCAALVA